MTPSEGPEHLQDTSTAEVKSKMRGKALCTDSILYKVITKDRERESMLDGNRGSKILGLFLHWAGSKIKGEVIEREVQWKAENQEYKPVVSKETGLQGSKTRRSRRGGGECPHCNREEQLSEFIDLVLRKQHASFGCCPKARSSADEIWEKQVGGTDISRSRKEGCWRSAMGRHWVLTCSLGCGRCTQWDLSSHSAYLSL